MLCFRCAVGGKRPGSAPCGVRSGRRRLSGSHQGAGNLLLRHLRVGVRKHTIRSMSVSDTSCTRRKMAHTHPAGGTTIGMEHPVIGPYIRARTRAPVSGSVSPISLLETPFSSQVSSVKAAPEICRFCLFVLPAVSTPRPRRPRVWADVGVHVGLTNSCLTLLSARVFGVGAPLVRIWFHR